MKAPKVTLAIPAYNEEKCIERTIKQMLAQTCGDFELLLGDNCSTDKTRLIMQHYANIDPRIRILDAPRNGGAVWNFGRLLAEAKGEYFAWIGAHDRYAPEWLSKLLKVMESDPTVVMTYSLARRILEDGTEFGRELQLLDTRKMRLYTRVKVLCTFHGAGERIYGLYRTVAAQKYPVKIVIRWDTLFLARLAFLGNVIGVDKALWFRLFHEIPTKKRNRAFYTRALERQYRIIYPEGQKKGFWHYFPHFYHLYYLCRDGSEAFPKEGWSRLYLTLHVIYSYTKRNRNNILSEWDYTLRHALRSMGVLSPLRKGRDMFKKRFPKYEATRAAKSNFNTQ